MLPGSERVMDRSTGQLVYCTPTLCPHANYSSNAQLTTTTTSTANKRLINLAPFSTFADVYTAMYQPPGPQSGPQAQGDMVSFLNYYLNPNVQWLKTRLWVMSDALGYRSCGGDFVRWDASPHVPFNVSNHTLSGWNASDIVAVYQALWGAR